MATPSNKRYRIEGTVAPGFESLKQLYEHNMNTWKEENTQLCVYYRGKKVVDLWASRMPDGGFNADSLVNVFSSGKSLEAIAMASLVGRGLLNYDAKIADYWPEFAANGKADISVADLMRHEAGLANFSTSLALEDLLTDNIKQNKIGRIIEQQAPDFGESESAKRQYHAVTRGWIANELFRRVEPTGRTIGEYLREEISAPLVADVMIGVKKEALSRISPILPLSILIHFLESMKPKFLGRGVFHNFFQIVGRIAAMVPAILKSNAGRAPLPFEGMADIAFFNEPKLAMGETPSANATCSARGLAKLAAAMSAGGTLEGIEILNETGWKAMHERPVEAGLGGLFPTRFTQGGLAQFQQCDPQCLKIEREFNEGREGFYGWMGLGGSIFQWHPEHDIGFAFIPTSLHILDFLNERGKTYQAEVLRCIANQG